MYEVTAARAWPVKRNTTAHAKKQALFVLFFLFDTSYICCMLVAVAVYIALYIHILIHLIHTKKTALLVHIDIYLLVVGVLGMIRIYSYSRIAAVDEC